jgi:hypothetical protein
MDQVEPEQEVKQVKVPAKRAKANDRRAETSRANIAKARAALAAKRRKVKEEDGEVIEELVLFDAPEEPVKATDDYSDLAKRVLDIQEQIRQDREERAARRAAKAKAAEAPKAAAPAPAPAPAKKPWEGIISC